PPSRDGGAACVRAGPIPPGGWRGMRPDVHLPVGARLPPSGMEIGDGGRSLHISPLRPMRHALPLLALCALVSALAPPTAAQSCIDGDCENGWGVYTWPGGHRYEGF